MKKINKVNITDKSINMKWYKKIIFIMLFCVLVIMITALIKFYFDVNKKDNQAYMDPNIITDLDSTKNTYKISKNDDGMVGVVDSEKRTVIEEQWNSVYFLNSNRFIVQKKINNKLLMGVIDNEENFVVPFIYKKFISVGKNYLAGYFADEDGFSIFDTSGNLLLDKKWLDYKYDNEKKVLVLTDGYISCNYVSQNNLIECIEVNTSYTMNSGSKCYMEYKTSDKNIIKNIGYKNINDIFRILYTYLEALVSNNMNGINSITNEQFLTSLSSNDIFKKCEINKISDIDINESNDEKNTYIISAKITYDYLNKDKKIENLKSLISLIIIKDDNSLILKSVNKEEL